MADEKNSTEPINSQTPEIVGPEVLQNFFDTVKESKELWAFTDGKGGLATRTRGEDNVTTSAPFWSSEELIKICDDDFPEHEITKISLDVLTGNILDALVPENILMGADWRKGGAGFDLPSEAAKGIFLFEGSVSVAPTTAEDVNNPMIDENGVDHTGHDHPMPLPRNNSMIDENGVDHTGHNHPMPLPQQAQPTPRSIFDEMPNGGLDASETTFESAQHTPTSLPTTNYDYFIEEDLTLAPKE